MPKIKITLSTIFIFLAVSLLAQERKTVTLEDIWAKGTFRSQYMPGFNWMSDDQYYSVLEENRIVRVRTVDGEKTHTIFNNTENLEIDTYEFNTTEDKILLATETEPIYRHSFSALYFIFDINSGKLRKLFPEKISYPAFSQDGLKIAFVFNNNLYYTDLTTWKTIAITQDGKKNSIINGSTDWVYEEEFSDDAYSFTRAFAWAPDGKKLAYYTFNESDVKEYNMQLWNDLYPTDYKYKYPKAGEKNSEVSIHCYFIETGEKNNY